MTDKLKQVIQDLINDRPEQAQAAIHDYLVGKMQTAAGLNEAAANLAAQVQNALEGLGEDEEFLQWYEDGEGWLISYEYPDFSFDVKEAGENLEVIITASGNGLSNWEDISHHGMKTDGDSPIETELKLKLKKSDVPADIDSTGILDLLHEKGFDSVTKVLDTLSSNKHYQNDMDDRGGDEDDEGDED